MHFPFEWMRSLHHDGSPRYLRADAGQVTVRLRARRDAPIQHVMLRTNPDGEEQLVPMRRLADDGALQWWGGELAPAMPRTNYRFRIITDAGHWWLTEAGITRYTPTDAGDFTLLPAIHGPAWVRSSVFYQIFPERFADGDPTNNVRNGQPLSNGRVAIARTWDELPQRPHGPHEFFGGDLQGITQHLDYLEELGINALYLTPIFTAPSSHKYDVADYTTVDPHFGGEAALAELRHALDRRGMRLLLDVVPNHCGAQHHWFTAAQRDPDAPTADFFTFRRHPNEYEAWLGVPSLPKLNYRSERLREAMYAGPDAVMRHWLRPPYRIDGWRIDVANMLARQGESQLGHKIGRAIRRAVKSENRDAYLLGENFFDGTPHLQGEELDATMNYRGFAKPLLHWLSGRDRFEPGPYSDNQPLPTDALAAQWQAFRAAIPWQIAVQQFNLLGSHDTPRLRTVLGDDMAKVRLAMALLFTYPGVPCVYYGDEIGMQGGPDPDCRRPMPWDAARWDTDLRGFVQQLTHLRRTAPALCDGGFQMLHAAGETVAFLRDAPAGRLLVVARRAPDALAALAVTDGGVADGTRFRELFSGAEAQIEGGLLPLVSLPAVGAQVWIEHTV